MAEAPVSSTTPKAKPPRLNHVALSMPSSALEPAGREEIVKFYGEVFGWQEYPQMTIDGHRLVLGLHVYDQFVFLVDNDHPLQAPQTDHFGLSVATKEEFDSLLATLRERAAADPRISVEHEVDDQEVVIIHSIYVHHLLPLTVEVQWWEWPDRAPA